MFNFLKGKVQRWAAGEQRSELNYFIDMLKGTDSETRALVIGMTAHIRNTIFMSKGFLEAKKNSTERLFLVRLYGELQKKDMKAFATGVSVWLHIIRAHYEPSNRFLVLEMWNLLKSSMPMVEQQVAVSQIILATELDISNYESMMDEYYWLK